MIDRRDFIAGSTVLLAACAQGPAMAPPAAEAAPVLPPIEPPPLPRREFRGAWVATVSNIDWPSKPGLSAPEQRAEALAILERARALGLNALILQVRPAGDALYRSALEPWSEYLTGEQGRAPAEAGWDPLAFWVAQAHQRGMELHAWFNPYRARHSSARSPLAHGHLGRRQPQLVKAYGDMVWMDPGEPAAAAHTLAVVADVVRRYDIDGVHIDDYFYPYPVPVPGAASAPGRDAPEVPFPDDASWARYQLGGGTLSREDWRRDNVNRLVQAMHRTVHEIKPHVRFGISPFGLGRPERRPPGISGFSQYDKLYADVELWLAQGWLDYLVPQLYWPIDREGQPFAVLLDTWLAENAMVQRHLWPGLFTSQVRRSDEPVGPRAWPAREIADQVAAQRARPAATGHVHFSMTALMQDRDGVATLLRDGTYAETALTPATPWLADGAAPPAAPRLRRHGGALRAEAAGPPPARWAVWRRTGGAWRLAVQGPQDVAIDPQGADAVALAAIDRVGLMSERTLLRL